MIDFIFKTLGLGTGEEKRVNDLYELATKNFELEQYFVQTFNACGWADHTTMKGGKKLGDLVPETGLQISPVKVKYKNEKKLLSGVIYQNGFTFTIV